MSDWTSVDEYPMSQLSGLTQGAETHFELRRNAAFFRFRGASTASAAMAP